MATVNESFPSAPPGRRIILGTVFGFAVVLVVFAGGLYGAMKKHRLPRYRDDWLVLATPVIPLAFGMGKFFRERSRVSTIRIENNLLVLGKKSYPLEGLVEAVRDPEVLKNARKRYGNGGLGAIRGKYRSKRNGDFETFLTDPEKAVVLKWPGKAIAVSPADPEFFIYSARSAAGLR
jgi:hypothetical protein